MELQAARRFAGHHQGAHQALRALLGVGLAEVRLYRGVLALSVKASSQVAELGDVTSLNHNKHGNEGAGN